MRSATILIVKATDETEKQNMQQKTHDQKSMLNAFHMQNRRWIVYIKYSFEENCKICCSSCV